jgi:hypothetical protein
VIAVTDQFSWNVTVMAFSQAGRNWQITKLVKIGPVLYGQAAPAT